MKYYLVLLVFFVLIACESGKEHSHLPTTDAVAVEIRSVATQPISSSISLSGYIEGKTTVKLGFMVPGKVDYISNKEGESISKGQLISRLESTNFTIAKELADVQLNSAKDDYDRLDLMHKKGSLSESDFSKATFSLQQASLQQRLQAKNLEDSRLYSPLTGILLRKHVEVGEVISSGAPLFIVADIRSVVVYAFIPEGELHQVAIGQPAVINIAALNKTFPGKVTEVGAMADEASRAFTVKVEVENADLEIRPGMIAEVAIAGKSRQAGILVPAACLGRDVNGQRYLYVADIKQNKAFKRVVSLGGMTENMIEVISGLSVGEAIVTAGHAKLSDGAAITIIK